MFNKIFKIFIVCILLISCLRIGDTRKILTYEPLKHSNLPNFPVHIYIDKDIPNKFQNEIKEAFKSWEYVSNNTISFKLHFGQEKPGKFKDIIDNRKIKYFIWYFSKDDESNIEQSIGRETWLAMHMKDKFGNRNIVIFSDMVNEETTKNRFYKIILHEIGHFLGLEHSNGVSVLSKTIDIQSFCITKKDAINLCNIYKCTPRPEC